LKIEVEPIDLMGKLKETKKLKKFHIVVKYNIREGQ